MRVFLKLSLFSATLFLAFFISGCASTQTTQKPALNRKEQIQVDEKEKVELMQQADNADSINDKINLTDSVAREDRKIMELKAGRKTTEDPSENRDDRDGFKPTKERTIVYGPLGAVLHFTEWILVKLYIMHES